MTGPQTAIGDRFLVDDADSTYSFPVFSSSMIMARNIYTLRIRMQRKPVLQCKREMSLAISLLCRFQPAQKGERARV